MSLQIYIQKEEYFIRFDSIRIIFVYFSHYYFTWKTKTKTNKRNTKFSKINNNYLFIRQITWKRLYYIPPVSQIVCPCETFVSSVTRARTYVYILVILAVTIIRRRLKESSEFIFFGERKIYNKAKIVTKKRLYLSK